MAIRKIRCIWHPIAGAVIGALIPFHFGGAVILFIGFMAYQFYQDKCNRISYKATDKSEGKLPDSFIDIEEMLAGLFPAVPITLLIKGVL